MHLGQTIIVSNILLSFDPGSLLHWKVNLNMSIWTFYYDSLDDITLFAKVATRRIVRFTQSMPAFTAGTSFHPTLTSDLCFFGMLQFLIVLYPFAS